MADAGGGPAPRRRRRSSLKKTPPANGLRAAGKDPAVYRQSLTVDYSYPVHFTRGLLRPDNPLLASVFAPPAANRPHRLLVCLDRGFVEATPGIAEDLRRYLRGHAETVGLVRDPLVLPGGEHAKTGWDGVRRLMTAMGDAHLCRHSYVLVFGGGSVLDMVGFAASIVHRGLRLIRAPTTVLSQNDAGVGVKNGMDEHGQKNFVGTFAPPCAVLNDTAFLHTLADRDWLGGIAEAFKVAVIKDRAFFEFLLRQARALRRRDDAAMAQLVQRCAVLHLEHIRTGGDPFEFGAARPLDFGHWAGHRLEVMSGFRMGHGQAVSVGIAVDSFVACRRGLLSEQERDRVVAGLTACGLPVFSPLLAEEGPGGEPAVLQGLVDFREHLGGQLTVTLPHGIGDRVEVHDIDAAQVAAAIAWLRERAAPAAVA